jgi:hypothetical protein
LDLAGEEGLEVLKGAQSGQHSTEGEGGEDRQANDDTQPRNRV